MTGSVADSGASEQLQADVMRFVAIIAICMLAVMALVRTPAPAAPIAVGAEGRTPPSNATRDSAPGVPDASGADGSPGERSAQPVMHSVATALHTVEPPAATPTPSAASWTEVQPMPAPPVVDTGRSATPPAPLARAPAPRRAAAGAPESPVSTPGLTLRFASERAFLRLFNEAAIDLWLEDANGATWRVDSRLQPTHASARGVLRELLPETVPAIIRESIRRTPQAAGIGIRRWLITLPVRTESGIAPLLGQGSGSIVIDVRGEVHHEA